MNSTNSLCGAVYIKDGRVLTLMRKNTNSLNIPTGVINGSQKPEELILLKTKQELGVEASIERCLGRYEFSTYNGKREIYLYKIKIEKGTPRLMHHEKFEKIAYIPVETIENYIPRAKPYLCQFCRLYAEEMKRE